MLRRTTLLLALATLSVSATLSLAQSTDPNGPGNAQDNTQNSSQMNGQMSGQNSSQMNGPMNGAPMQSQPAPIERGMPENQGSNAYPNANPNASQSSNTYISNLRTGQFVAATTGTASAQPAAGVFLRVGQNSSVRVVAVGGENTELRVERGIANIGVHQPVKNAHILVDLPGGQTSLIKDGFYTFNADTNTVRVLTGEAYAYPASNGNRKPIKIKGNHAVIFNGREMKAFEFDPFEARADLIPYGYGNSGPSPYGYSGYGPYGYAYGGYPYWGYGYPYYFPFGFGWGWGWGGGWGGYYGGGYGGYRGGYGGGGYGGGGFHGGGGGGGGGGHR